MLAHGFSIDMMVELVNAGLARARGRRSSYARSRAGADHKGGARGTGREHMR
jgi:hypothetical protein